MAESSDKTPELPTDTSTNATTPKTSLVVRAKHWGEYLLNLLLESPLPPTLLATLAFAQHARPFQFVPMVFPPLLLFSTYLNLNGYKIDSAGVTAALSGSYLVLASRRRHGIWSTFSTRGIIRGATMGLALANLIGGGLAYTFGKRSEEESKRAGQV